MMNDMDGVKVATEIANNATETVLNLWEIVERIFPGIALGREINEAHMKNIQNFGNLQN